jgi:hypothetical protein
MEDVVKATRLPSGDTAIAPTLSSLATSSGVIGRAVAVAAAASEIVPSKVAVSILSISV